MDFLIISSVWPEPDSSAAGQRMMQLIRLFRASGWDITYACTAAESEFMADMDSYSINCVSIRVNSSSFDDFIDELQPAMVMFDRFPIEEQFGWRVIEQCPQALRILDSEDLHCLRRVRHNAVKSSDLFTETDLLGADDSKREIASIYRCDLTLVISEYEVKLLRNIFKVDSALLQYLPFLLDPVDKAEIQSWLTFENRNHFMTIGNFRHAPNWDSVQYLHEEIWPRIAEQLPEAELHIYGAYPTAMARSLHQPEKRFFIDGRAKSAREVIGHARVCLAPLRFGAGLKGKLVQAMQCGTPTVTTRVGAEGIAGRKPWPGIIVEDPGEIADAAVKLYTNNELWEEAQQRGIEIINERFAKEPFSSELINRIESIRNELDTHRLENFTGAMLQHHTAASTKYMARWIEEKNSE